MVGRFHLLELLIYYLIAINLAAFAAFGIDKARAEAGRWRIRESTLLGLSLAGGLPGALAGRQAFRHKTRKKSFTSSLIAVAMTQVVIVVIAITWNSVGGPASRLAAAYIAPKVAEAEKRWKANHSYRVLGIYGCDAVRAAGKAPLYRGQSGYLPSMDADNDGVACEPIP